MNIALVMLPYHSDEPAGIERSLASLAAGLRELGHRTIVVAAGSRHAVTDPDVVHLTSVTFPRPVPYEEIPALLADTATIGQEVRQILEDHETDIVVWGDAVSGLGFLGPAPRSARTALMVHFPRTDDGMHQSLAHKPDAVITVSPFMVEEAARAGIDSSTWRTLPNALLCKEDPPARARREELRRTGPVRVVARADPAKGVADLLRCVPPELNRPVQIVLAKAGFEISPGLQDAYLRECSELADALDAVELLPPLPWNEVQSFFAGAAVAVVPSTAPESFCNVAAEALSVGTPVLGFRMGHLPVLAGPGGRTVDVTSTGEESLPVLTGPAAHMPSVARHMRTLWDATTGLLDDHDGYHTASRHGPSQTASYTPAAVAEQFLRMMES
ncbi:glycosyltransferase family 4 protein [Streptomyces acidiscabies]|uniref:Glycosyltransferase family 4 protein n=1 Tax=Streptomyces acidiscabies TaxID=42234 RepID=A0AAP6BLI4_9ACTN|nr:glycosyltransferase family 4 protein [Streptomyces acidiscabies]MBP5935518.1 glycosyltransferase family 4 protein [Streptomyces sp. LBUM 1476]MBZ3916610.1 glycosyltransferase family 4 protein [Streptomyces acidiscabies]MDX2966885.1 glycosyltransferase family 4 protein [Streptomyces acidiscabies]MDX3020288.1 glycosyltransferase family 4 protein [Streptomyces acidiscabies]MDX3791722.1 glycosyltransferase family 4 protein [Streptomyces acidiscabies]